MNLPRLFSVVLLILPLSRVTHAASLEKARLLNDHGLTESAKRELIDLLFESKPSGTKAQAYYLLGSIAFQENRVSLALDTWQKLIKNHPSSPEAQLVAARLNELADIVGASEPAATQNAVAQSYLRHAHFWSRDRDRKFTIDSSWIPRVETAIHWYDKVIKEFPGSPAAEKAYEGKLRTLLGWETGSGLYKEQAGLRQDFDKYIRPLVTTFGEYMKAFPKAPYAQAFRFQIAQAYWKQKKWDKCKAWLDRIIQVAGDNESFYKDLAQRRLAKLEY